MKVGKPKSKRVPVRLRHKIEKASAAKQRKARKEAKKNPQWRSRLKKDPGIPNLFPYKDKILAEVEEGRRRKEEEIQKRRDLAKAQKAGTAVADAGKAAVALQAGDDNDEVLDDVESASDEDDAMDEDAKDPMAALLASAEAWAQDYSKHEEEDDEDDEADEQAEWGGIKDKGTATPAQPVRRALPQQALADPIKTVSALLDRLQKTQEGIQQLIDYYEIPPLVTATNDFTSRFLVEVARKRGRLGRGGVPNLNAAAFTVLGDLNDERMRLPALETKAVTARPAAKGEVRIVKEMAEPFRIEGLFNDGAPSKGVAMQT